MVDKVVGAVVGNVVGKALGGGGSAQARPTSQPTTVAGTEFQPFTYTGLGGSVTGTQQGDYGYGWSAEVPQWIQDLGAMGQGAAGGLFKDYYAQLQQDPYAAGEEFYKRGLAQLEPELAKQQIQAQERMFGTGRLGLKLAGAGLGAPAGTGAVSPDAFGLGAAQAKSLQDLYTTSLSQGQAMQTQRLNQLSQAANAALALGMRPADVEQGLIEYAKNLEAARSNAIKAGTQQLEYKNTPQQVFGSQLGNIVGSGAQSYVGGLFNSGSAPSSYTGTWSNPDNFYSSGSSWDMGYSPMEASIYGL